VDIAITLLTTLLQHKLLFQMAVELLRFLLGVLVVQRAERVEARFVMVAVVATLFLR
jgi:hypothetical protein